MPAFVTIREIAARARLSPAAVSHALRNSPEVSAATQTRVRRIAVRMGWRPNPSVAAWMAHRRLTSSSHQGECIAFLNCFPSLQRWRQIPSFTRFLEGARRRSEDLGYRLEEFWLADPSISRTRFQSILEARGIRGVIIGSASTADGSLELDWSRFSMAAQGFSVIRPDVSRSATDYTHALNLIISEVRKLGYRRIGLHLWPQVDARCQRQLSGAFLAYQGLIPRNDRVPMLYEAGDSISGLRKWLKTAKPQVVITHEIALLSALRETGVNVPVDIGFALTDLHLPPHQPELSHVGCAGVDMMVETAGAAAVDLIVTQLLANETGPPAYPKIVLTRGRWVPGSTLRKVGRSIGSIGSLTETSLLVTGSFTASQRPSPSTRTI